jgi:hypothetical protein
VSSTDEEDLAIAKQEGKDEEREEVVAFMRHPDPDNPSRARIGLADAIERGEHERVPPSEPMVLFSVADVERIRGHERARWALVFRGWREESTLERAIRALDANDESAD